MKILVRFLFALTLLNITLGYAAEITRQHKQTIEDVLIVFDRTYVYPEVALKMRNFIEQKYNTGEYSQIDSQRELLNMLQEDLRAVSNDNHISLHLHSDMVDSKNHAIARQGQKPIEFELVTPQLAHLTLNTFGGGDKTKLAISQAINSASNTKAILIDLRGNGGGDPDLVSFLSSYFLPENTFLWSIIDRNGQSIMDASTSALPKGQNRYQGQVYILISQKTYSAPEAFADILQSRGIATVVGEASGGGAHLVKIEPASDAISVRMPVVRAYNPVTKGNWEGHGVIPNISSSSKNAKSAAIKHFQKRTMHN